MSELRGMRSVHASIVLLLATASCNVARMHTRHCDRALVRAGYVRSVFMDTTGAHAVWSRDTGRPKLLLLHGYTGTGALQWSRTARLMRDHDAVIPDLLSHGASAKWDPRLPGTSLDAQVDHVITILDSLGLRTALSVVGNSYGGGVAAVLTERHPERVARLVIYDGLVSDYTSALADSIARAAGGEGMLAIMRTPTPRDLRLGIRLSLYRDPPLPGFLLRQIFEENVRPFRAAQILLIQDLMQHEERFATRRFNRTVPVFVIWGERDELIPNTTGRAILHRNSIPETHWTVIPRTGHVANMERPRAFVRALEQVLGR